MGVRGAWYKIMVGYENPNIWSFQAIVNRQTQLVTDWSDNGYMVDCQVKHRKVRAICKLNIQHMVRSIFEVPQHGQLSCDDLFRHGTQ